MNNEYLASSVKSKIDQPSEITGYIDRVHVSFEYDCKQNGIERFSDRLESELGSPFGELQLITPYKATPFGKYRFGNTENTVGFSENNNTAMIMLTDISAQSGIWFKKFATLFESEFNGKVEYFCYKVDVPDGSYNFEDAYRFFFQNFGDDPEGVFDGFNETSENESIFHSVSCGSSAIPDGIFVHEKGKKLGLDSPWLEWFFMVIAPIPWRAVHDPRYFFSEYFKSVDWLRNIPLL